MRRRVQIVAESVAVLCPFCGDAQPNQDGCEMWIPEDFQKHGGKRACVSCMEPILIMHDTKVQFPVPIPSE